jgi:hypothetical protein
MITFVVSVLKVLLLIIAGVLIYEVICFMNAIYELISTSLKIKEAMAKYLVDLDKRVQELENKKD